MTREERFWAKVDRRGDQECWEWQAYIEPRGYGRFRGGGRRQLAHRYAYELLVGPIPDGLHIDHLCRNRRCVNPAHMEPVTMRENILRGMASGAVAVRTNRCARGHDLTHAPPRPRGVGRYCSDCARERARAYRAKYRGQEPPEHGTLRGYKVYGCRCPACRGASALYWQSQKERALLTEAPAVAS